MILVDTHTHLYLENFSDDRNEVVQNAIKQGVYLMLLPAIDISSFDSMKELSANFPNNCLPMIGLHPTSVKDDYEKEMQLVEEQLAIGGYIAVGEIGIDLYWDKTHFEQQKDAFRRQLKLAKKYHLPVAIHTRDSFKEIYPIVVDELTEELTGVFHCFTGSIEEAKKIMDIGLMMGIGGIITFKNSGLSEVVQTIPFENLLLETDAPFLTPAPFRGKRNQSAYLNYIANKLAEVKGVSTEYIAEITTHNANKLFKLI
ncbi:MAG: TatD family hydrolase [Bacteroidetes bacterium]|nr:TatD family hydrolase [Bacteroidota bacterium]